MRRTTPDGFEVLMWLLHPRSRGYVRLASANPFENPLIDPRFLSQPGDVDMFVSGK